MKIILIFVWVTIILLVVGLPLFLIFLHQFEKRNDKKIEESPCPKCGGFGVVEEIPSITVLCNVCKGKGWVKETES